METLVSMVGSLQQATLRKVESIKNVSLRKLHYSGSNLLQERQRLNASK